MAFFCNRRIPRWHSSVTEEYQDGENSYCKLTEEYQDGENSYCEFFGLVPFLQ
jgi:hypothetical protein